MKQKSQRKSESAKGNGPQTSSQQKSDAKKSGPKKQRKDSKKATNETAAAEIMQQKLRALSAKVGSDVIMSVLKLWAHHASDEEILKIYPRLCDYDLYVIGQELL